MDCKIEKMGAFWVYGAEYRFAEASIEPETPAFWESFFQSGYQGDVCPAYGICLQMRRGEDPLRYLIGDVCAQDAAVPEGLTKREIPAHLWAKFRVNDASPELAEHLLSCIITEWMNEHGEYEHTGWTADVDSYEIETYSGRGGNTRRYCNGIWIPLKKKG